jgi:hypothetical protein
MALKLNLKGLKLSWDRGRLTIDLPSAELDSAPEPLASVARWGEYDNPLLTGTVGRETPLELPMSSTTEEKPEEKPKAKPKAKKTTVRRKTRTRKAAS